MTELNSDGQPSVRQLARRGVLATHFEQADLAERRRLRIDGYELVQPVVFGQLTRKVEGRRGHRDCQVSVSNLRPDCLDRFHDDMDAVLDDLFSHARGPIQNLEGWVSRRVLAVTIDAHRRRRGGRGALQRPRIPRWLARELNQDKRLIELALEMLEWVGVETTAGAHEWPIEVWTAQRVAAGGDYDLVRRSVSDDVTTVLAAMHKHPKWYADYVERPLGHKRPPVALNHQDGKDQAPDPDQAAQTADAADEARRTELAALAVEVIKARIERGEDMYTVVVEVISMVFGAGTGSESMNRAPGLGCADDERVYARLADPETVERIVAVVLDLLA